MANHWKQAKYNPINPDKYLGKLDNIVFRSSWEEDAFKFCDGNPNVLHWSSEEIAIPYMVPTTGGNVRRANYYPDLYIEFMNADGKLCREIIEIKPYAQTQKSRARDTRRKMIENEVYMKNQLKWEAARAYCVEHGLTFRIITERNQFK